MEDALLLFTDSPDLVESYYEDYLKSDEAIENDLRIHSDPFPSNNKVEMETEPSDSSNLSLKKKE